MFRGSASDGPDTAITLTGSIVTGSTGPDDVIIRNFNIYGNFDEGAIESKTGGPLRTIIGGGSGWNYIWTEGAEDLAVNLHATNTGWIGPNIAIRLQDDGNNIHDSVIGSDTQFIMPLEFVNANDETSVQIGTGTSHPASVDSP